MTIYQSAYQLKMGRCSRCLRDNIPEDHLFLAGSEEFAVLGADLGGNLGVHDAVNHDPQCFPQKVHVSVHTALA